MSIFESSVIVFVISFFVVTGFAVCTRKSRLASSLYLRLVILPFSIQVAILLILCAVEYDWFGLLPTGLWTILRVLCWLSSFFAPFVMQVYLLCHAPVLSRLSGILRVLTFGGISFPLTILGLILGHTLFILTGHGLLFD